MRGYNDAQARQIFRDLIDMPAQVTVTDREVTVRFHRRAHLPIVLSSGLFDKPIKVPWWVGGPSASSTKAVRSRCQVNFGPWKSRPPSVTGRELSRVISPLASRPFRRGRASVRGRRETAT
jgi:hypothetical protein